jgi:hypothetical protein
MIHGLGDPGNTTVTIGWVLRGHEPRRQSGRPATRHERVLAWWSDVVAGTPGGAW